VCNSEVWFISLIFAINNPLVGHRKKYEIYQLFKDKNISKSTIKDIKNSWPCVVNRNIAKPRVVDTKEVQNCVSRTFKTEWERRYGLWPGKTTPHTLQFFEF
jgi:hypothetical protein